MLNSTHYLFRLSAAVLIGTAIVGCDTTLTPEEKLEKARAAVGMDASIAAAMLVSAARSCQVVGEDAIDKCVQVKGTLVAEQSAQLLANLAIGQREGYWKKCQTNFDKEYCGQLIQRAVAIELRKPRNSE